MMDNEVWAIVELRDRRIWVGSIKEMERVGEPMLRIQMFSGNDTEPAAVHWVSGVAIYAVRETTEEWCRKHTKGIRDCHTNNQKE